MKHQQLVLAAMCSISYILHLCKGTDVDKQKVFEETDILSHMKLYDKRTFEILTQSSNCLHKNLTSCLSDEEKYYNYFERCFSDKCSRDDYVCLNDKKGNTLHICGQTKPCKKRYRNIIVHKSVPSKSVDVYSMQCPLGHFQANDNICFDTCVKDESITIVSDATDHRPAIARCSIERNYCNRKGVSRFEVGSDDDVCVHAYHDLNLRCKDKEELVQDCSCQPKCRPGEARVWNGSFICKPDPSYTGSVTDDKDITEDFTKTVLNSNQSVLLQTNITDSLIVDGPFGKDVETKVEDGTHITVLTLGFVVVAILLGVAVVLLIYLRNKTKDADYHNVTKAEITNEETTIVKADNWVNNTKADYRVNNVFVNGENVIINLDNENRDQAHPDASTDDQTSSLDSISDNEPLLESQHMENLKECENRPADSGIYTGNETERKVMA